MVTSVAIIATDGTEKYSQYVHYLLSRQST